MPHTESKPVPGNTSPDGSPVSARSDVGFVTGSNRWVDPAPALSSRTASSNLGRAGESRSNGGDRAASSDALQHRHSSQADALIRTTSVSSLDSSGHGSAQPESKYYLHDDVEVSLRSQKSISKRLQPTSSLINSEFEVEDSVQVPVQRTSVSERVKQEVRKKAFPISAVILTLFVFIATVNVALFFTLRKFEQEATSHAFHKFGVEVMTTMHLAGTRGLERAILTAMQMTVSLVVVEIVKAEASAANLLQSARRLVHSAPAGSLRIDPTDPRETPELERAREMLWSLQHVAQGLALVPNLLLFNNTTGDFLELWREPASGSYYWCVTTMASSTRTLVTTFALDEATGMAKYGDGVGHSVVSRGVMEVLTGGGRLPAEGLLWMPPGFDATWRTDLDGPTHSRERVMHVLTTLIDDNGKVDGILGSGVRLLDIGMLLRSLLTEEEMVAFIFEREGTSVGQIIAASHGVLDLPNVTASGWDHSDINFVGARLLDEFGSWAAIPHNASRVYDMLGLDGSHAKTLYVHTEELGVGNGLAWMAVLMLDEDPFLLASLRGVQSSLAEMERATHSVRSEFRLDNWWGYSSLFVQVTLTLLLWWALQMFLVRPMAALVRQMKAIETLSVPEKEPEARFQPFKEMRKMENTFDSMTVVPMAFGKFVPKVVVQRIMAREPRATDLYVFPVICTIMFSDIANFTSISEQVPLPTLMRVLEDYLADMAAIIEASGGVIGDFIGDGIMAFWNSPTPVDHHELKAAETMEAQVERLAFLNNRWSGWDVPPVWPRYGIHVGKVYSGNIGSQEKMKFGIVGDPVNLAARLESLCKKFGARNLVTRQVYEGVQDEFLGFLHAKLVFKGHAKPVWVYELLCRRVLASQKHLQLCRHMDACFQFIASRDYELACNALRHVKELQLEILGSHKGSTLSCEERVQKCLNDPAVSWNGVEDVTDK